MKTIEYGIFKEIYDVTKRIDNVDMYIMENGYPAWTLDYWDEDDVASYIDFIKKVHKLSHMTLKEIRTEKGLLMREFAEAYGIPFRTYQDWETENTARDYVMTMLAYIIFVEDMNDGTVE